MVRFLGAALVALGGAWLGRRAAENLRLRARALEDVAVGLALLERELELSQAPMPQLMERLVPASRGPARALFSGCQTALARLEEEPLSTAWRRLAEELTVLGEEGQQCLAALGDTLGRWDSREQRQAVSVVRGRLEELARRAEQDFRRQSGVYRALGLSGGAFPVILLA